MNTYHNIELDDEWIGVSVEWEVSRCECTSECGNQTVTEKWAECTPISCEWESEFADKKGIYEFKNPEGPIEEAIQAAFELGDIYPD
jgi:hypothetical protein